MLAHTQTMGATCTGGGFYEANDSLTKCTVNLIFRRFIRVDNIVEAHLNTNSSYSLSI